MGILMLVLVTATLLETRYGSSFIFSNIYHSPWFIALWTLLAISAMTYILYVSRRGTLIMLHVSFAVILLGALTSFLTSIHGNITLVKDTVPASMFTTNDGKLEKLPFSLQVTDIDTIYSDDYKQAINYKAHIISDDKREKMTHSVSLNSPISLKGFSFCINGIEDGRLSLLVAHDTYGLPISYTGYLMMFVSFMTLFFDRQSGFRNILKQLQEEKGKKKEKENIHYKNRSYRLEWILTIPVITLCILWYKKGNFPVTNGAESLFLLAIVMTVLAALLKHSRNFTYLSKALIITAGATAIIALCSYEPDNGIQPILRSPLLGVHVSTIIIAYALLFCTAINAIAALCAKNRTRKARLTLLGRAMLYPATMLLATGIFIGAVWANISWGRYWGWDPKEVWALTTLLGCSIVFHTRSLPFIAKPLFFHIYCIAIFTIMLFTYFGVNYLLGGIHSYA